MTSSPVPPARMKDVPATVASAARLLRHFAFAAVLVSVPGLALPAASQTPSLLGQPTRALVGEDPSQERAEPAREGGELVVALTPDYSRWGAASGAAPGAVGSGFGRSREVRVLIVEPGAAIAAWELAAGGEGWGEGHRWTSLHASPDAPAVLGDATAEPPFQSSPINAPGESGVWHLTSASGAEVTVVVRVPHEEKRAGLLNGYRIGSYPTEGSTRADAYRPPGGFIEVTPETRDLQVSRHLRLGQFLTKDQHDVWPKYVALDPRLLDKIELVIQELTVMGVRAEGVHVMSGFRTPLYNGPGGDGRAALSRHMWGDAADMWIDSDGNGMMDDLNGDGVVDLDDVAVIMRAVDRVERRHPELIGGAGVYPANAIRGPYIHIDVRGHHSRW